MTNLSWEEIDAAYHKKNKSFIQPQNPVETAVYERVINYINKDIAGWKRGKPSRCTKKIIEELEILAIRVAQMSYNTKLGDEE